MTVLGAKPFSEDTADKLGVSKRTVERLVQTARDLTPEAKKTIWDSGDKITKGAALKISRLPPDQQAEAAAVLTVTPPAKKKPDTADLESLLKEFKSHAQRFISGMTAFDQQSDTFARMSYVQGNELWNSAVAVTDVIRAFSKKVNHIKDELQGDHSHEN